MHDLDIIKINECLVAKILPTNVTEMNEHSNVATFVHALLQGAILHCVTGFQWYLSVSKRYYAYSKCALNKAKIDYNFKTSYL